MCWSTNGLGITSPGEFGGGDCLRGGVIVVVSAGRSGEGGCGFGPNGLVKIFRLMPNPAACPCDFFVCNSRTSSLSRSFCVWLESRLSRKSVRLRCVGGEDGEATLELDNALLRWKDVVVGGVEETAAMSLSI